MRLWMMALLVFTISVSTSFADTIIDYLPAALPNGGYWVGTSIFGDTAEVAGRFDTYRSYSNITGSARLGGYAYGPNVTLSIAAHDSFFNRPGAIIASTTLIASTPGEAVYSFAFAGLDLDDASTYWFVVTSDESGLQLPGINAALYQGHTRTRINGVWDNLLFNAIAFGLGGDVTGNEVENGEVPVPLPYADLIPTPEPSVIAQLAVGLLGVVFITSRTR